MRTFYDGCSEESRIALDIASKGTFLNLSEEEEENLICDYAKDCGDPDADYFKIGEKGTYTFERDLRGAIARIQEKYEKKRAQILRKYTKTVEVNFVNHATVDREYQDHRDDGSNSVLRSFLQESSKEQRPRKNHVNREVNSKYPQFHGSEQGFSSPPYIGGKGLYVSKELLEPDKCIADESKFDALDQQIRDMTANRDNVILKAEKKINAIRTSIGKRVSMEDATDQHKFDEWEYESTRSVRRKNAGDMSYTRTSHAKDGSENKEYCQFAGASQVEESRGTCENAGSMLTDYSKPLLDEGFEEDLYRVIVRTVDLVEGTPEHKVFFQNNSNYRTQYLNLERDKNRYENEKRWSNIKMAANRGTTSRSSKSLTEAPNREPPRPSEGGREGLKSPIETDGATDHMKTNMRKVEDMLWTASRYFAPLVINGTPVKACIFDVSGRSNTMPLSWAKTLGVKGNFYPIEITDDGDRSSGTIDYARNVVVEVGKTIVCTEFELVEDDNKHRGFITLGRDFLEETDAILNLKRGVMTLRSVTGYGNCPIQIRRRPMIFIYGEWVNLGLMEFYYNIVMTTISLPNKPLEEGYEVVGKKILELLDEYDSRKVRLKSAKDDDILKNSTEKPCKGATSPREPDPDRKASTNDDENGVHLFRDEELNFMRQCRDDDIPEWTGDISRVEAIPSKEDPDSLIRRILFA